MALIKRTKPVTQAAAPKPPAERYLSLQAWNLYLRASRQYNVSDAQAEKAPANAIFRAFDGHWATLDSLDAIPAHPFHAFHKKFLKENT